MFPEQHGRNRHLHEAPHQRLSTLNLDPSQHSASPGALRRPAKADAEAIPSRRPTHSARIGIICDHRSAAVDIFSFAETKPDLHLCGGRSGASHDLLSSLPSAPSRNAILHLRNRFLAPWRRPDFLEGTSGAPRAFRRSRARQGLHAKAGTNSTRSPVVGGLGRGACNTKLVF